MKKFIITLIGTLLLSVPHMHLIAGGGDTAAGAAIGLVGGMAIGSAMSRGGSRSRAAEDRARRAEEKAESVRYEQQKEQFKRQMAKGETSRTINILIFMVALLFLSVLGLGFAFLRKK